MDHRDAKWRSKVAPKTTKINDGIPSLIRADLESLLEALFSHRNAKWRSKVVPKMTKINDGPPSLIRALVVIGNDWVGGGG